MPALGTRTGVYAVCLFFIAVWPLAAEEARLPSAATNAAVDELRALVNNLGADNQRLQTDLEQRETII